MGIGEAAAGEVAVGGLSGDEVVGGGEGEGGREGDEGGDGEDEEVVHG